MTMSWYFSLANLLSNNAAQTIQSTNYTGTVEVVYVDTIGEEKFLFKTVIELQARSTGGHQ